MVYTETIKQTIKYDHNDVMLWIKTFAARQLNCTADEIKDEDIQITPECLKDIDITVSHLKVSTNAKS